MITDVEISRAVNALSTTLRDQRPPAFDRERFQSIADGALGGERKLLVRDGGALETLDGKGVGRIDRTDGQWVVTREVTASGSHVAVPGGSG